MLIPSRPRHARTNNTAINRYAKNPSDWIKYGFFNIFFIFFFFIIWRWFIFGLWAAAVDTASKSYRFYTDLHFLRSSPFGPRDLAFRLESLLKKKKKKKSYNTRSFFSRTHRTLYRLRAGYRLADKSIPFGHLAGKTIFSSTTNKILVYNK